MIKFKQSVNAVEDTPTIQTFDFISIYPLSSLLSIRLLFLCQLISQFLSYWLQTLDTYFISI